MARQRKTAVAEPTQPSPATAVVVAGFDYSRLEGELADKVRETAARIRERVKATLVSIIEVGRDLLGVKAALPHGQFSPWLRAEFGWTERSAQNFMSVAERFGPKTEIISDLAIQPTAAYLLAAPSTPDGARQAALERAEAGERITAAVARKIVAQARKRGPRDGTTVPPGELEKRLGRLLERYRALWAQEELPGLARQLREFADRLELPPEHQAKPKRGGKRKARK